MVLLVYCLMYKLVHIFLTHRTPIDRRPLKKSPGTSNPYYRKKRIALPSQFNKRLLTASSPEPGITA
jgi:hypothetical protein